ncbi:MAG TPA: amidohydrolase family protein [Cyclobacteriaceae bacterium]|nr:amidohydrolase family protein [Cyclobacteriaceae bacterium]
MDLLIRNVTWLDAELRPLSGDVRVSRDVIIETGAGLSQKKGEDVADFGGHFLYAGLINAHDHLEMNLYPRLGTPPYKNYTEWSKDIYHPDMSPLKEIEKTDIDYRLMWGGLKNLISGVTTVVHHNPWRSTLGKSSFPVVVPKVDWAHSLAFDQHLPIRAIREIRENPFVIHAAEGIDDFSRQEIHKLNELNLLHNNTVLVHGVGAQEAEWDLVASKGSSLAWCPSSNVYMFDRTTDVRSLEGRVSVVLGTDSTLTGSPTLLDEMKIAANYSAPRDIVRMTGIVAAKVFGLPEPVIRVGNKADFFIAPKKKDDAVENLLNIGPYDIAMVVVRGKIMLRDKKFTTINVDKLRSYFEKKIGTGILEQNPLWRMIV